MKPFLSPTYRAPERFGRVSEYLASWRPNVNDGIERRIRAIAVTDSLTRVKRTTGMGACVGAAVAGAGAMLITGGASLLAEGLVGSGHMNHGSGMLAGVRKWGVTGLATDSCIRMATRARQQERGLTEAGWASLGMLFFTSTECARIVLNACFVAVEGAGALLGAAVGVFVAAASLAHDFVAQPAAGQQSLRAEPERVDRMGFRTSLCV